jgi:hypothetical protein
MDDNPENKKSFTTKYQVAFLKYVENEYCAKHPQMSVIKSKNDLHTHFLPPAKASGLGPWCFNVYDLSTDDDEYITPGWVA